MILIVGLRYRVGVDTINYMNSYLSAPSLDKYIKNFSLTSVRDPLFHFLESLFRTYTSEFWPFQLVMTSITTIGITVFINRSCINPFIGLAIFIILNWLYFTTEIIRESAAISIFLLNYRNIEQKRFFKFYLYSFLSIGFHFSAFITWIIPFCTKLKINLFYILICVGIIMSTPLLDNINQLLAIATIADKVDQYMNQAELLNINWRLAELFKTATIPLALVAVSKIRTIHISFQGMVLLQIIFCLGTFAVPIIFSRFTNYTALFVVTSVSNVLIYKTLNKNIKIILSCLIIISQVYSFSKIYQRWFPYISIFNPHQVKERENIWYDEYGG